MLPDGMSSGAFIRSMFALSTAFMDRMQTWEKDFMPKVYLGVTKEAMEQLKSPFDFIVVGSGHAGSLVAHRLASTGCYRVLLLEAGGVPDFEHSVPFMQPKDITKHSWPAYTIDQRYSSQGLNNKSVHLMLGKVFGGTSVLQNGVFLPENPDDFDRWASQYSLKEWSAEKVEPFFFSSRVQEHAILDPMLDAIDRNVSNDEQSSEQSREVDTNTTVSLDTGFTPRPSLETPSARFARLGHQTVLDAIRKRNPLSYLWMQAGLEMGYPIQSGTAPELYENGGFFMPNAMTQEGFKMTPPTEFLKHSGNNLVIITNAEVTRLMFDNRRQAAAGVEFVDNLSKLEHRARAGGEVILSAGPLGTSKILMESGIGPSDHLKELGIPVIQHLPVGILMRDRVSASLFVKMNSMFTENFQTSLTDIDEIHDYLKNGTGIFASPRSFGAAILKTEAHLEPNLLIEAKPIGFLGPTDSLEQELNYNKTTIDAINPSGDLSSRGALQIDLTLLNPYSVGTLWLRRDRESRDTKFRLMTNPAYLQDSRDLSTLVRGAQFVEAMMDTPYMKLMDAQLLRPTFAGCPSRFNRSITATEYWECVIEHISTTGRHLTSTAAMLHVTEPNLKVRGVQRLRIIDSSVFPEPVTGGYAATLMAVANRGAQMAIDENQDACLLRRSAARH